MDQTAPDTVHQLDNIIPHRVNIDLEPDEVGIRETAYARARDCQSFKVSKAKDKP